MAEINGWKSWSHLYTWYAKSLSYNSAVHILCISRQCVVIYFYFCINQSNYERKGIMGGKADNKIVIYLFRGLYVNFSIACLGFSWLFIIFLSHTSNREEKREGNVWLQNNMRKNLCRSFMYYLIHFPISQLGSSLNL